MDQTDLRDYQDIKSWEIKDQMVLQEKKEIKEFPDLMEISEI
jgi:hypothetical protein